MLRLQFGLILTVASAYIFQQFYHELVGHLLRRAELAAYSTILTVAEIQGRTLRHDDMNVRPMLGRILGQGVA